MKLLQLHFQQAVVFATPSSNTPETQRKQLTCVEQTHGGPTDWATTLSRPSVPLVFPPLPMQINRPFSKAAKPKSWSDG